MMENKCLLGRCFRVYVTKTQEIFELFDGKKSTAIRWVFNYGESLAFLTEDWVKEDEQTIKQIMDHVDQGTEYILTAMQRVQNPFLCLLCMRLVSQLQGEYNLHSEITNFYYQLHKARKDAYILLADCLYMETKSVCARYCELWKGESPRLVHVCIKPIPAFLLNDGNNRPEIVDTESMCCDKKMQLVEICYPENVLALYDFLKSIYLRRAIRFKHCRLCGKLFAAVDGERTGYCSRKYSGNKSCRDIGAVRIYQKKILSNPITRAYNRAYKTHNARIRYGTMTREEFQTWVAEAKRLRDVCQSGNISLDCFEEWLKQ